jgi:1-acyl-sn-glycerol-3-phosphate acyltransferase
VQAGLPIVPISVIGSRHVMRKGRLTTKPGFVRVVVHDPIPTHAAAEPDTRAVRALASRVREIVRPAVELEAESQSA